MSLYESSTQATLWMFNIDALKALRTSITTEACERIQRSFEKQDMPSSFLNAQEELVLVNYYASQMEGLTAYFEFSSHIKATAITYLKRFYLLHSVMDYHPKPIMLTCLFLATKACDHYISLDQFVHSIPKVTSAMILEHEFIVCRALSWNFYVWHAYRPLHGFILDMQVILSELSIQTLGKLHDEAKTLISKTLWTDLQFLYSPSFIALGCLMAVDAEMVQLYVKRKNMDQLLERIETVSKEVVSHSKTMLNLDEVKEIDKRLFYCSDPIKKKDGFLYAKRRVQEEEVQQIKKHATEMMSLERVGRICWLKLTSEMVYLVVVPDYTGTQVWAILEVKSIFEDYHVQSNTNDTINLEVPVDSLHKALKSSVNASEIVLRLTKQDHFPMLSCSISLLGKSGGMSAVTHNIHVRVLSPLMQLSEPVVPEPDCHIILPPLSQLRYISERFRAISNKIILKANMSGEFQIGVVSDLCKIETKFKDLINPELDPNTVEDISKHPSQIRDRKAFVTMKVDVKDWLNLLQVHIVAKRVIACFCEAHALVLYVYIMDPEEEGSAVLVNLFMLYRKIKSISTLGVLGAGVLYYYIVNRKKDYLNQDIYRFCTIRAIRRLSPSVCLYELEFDRPSKQFRDLPIQSILLKNSDMQIQRYYTPISLDPLNVTLLVKCYEDGEVSRWIHRKRVGDRMQLRGPFLEWAWDDYRWKRILFIAGGTGIAPAYQLLSYIFRDSNQQIPEFHLMYANRSLDEILLKEELDRFQEKYPKKIKITYFVDTFPENSISNEYFFRKIALQDVNEAFPPWTHTELDTIVLVCGTDGFVSYMAGPPGILHGEQGSRGGLLEKANYLNVWKL
ncbi:hypothetical protein PCANB_000856 [Pneumocystis canis]|nr:hypothetical protein PCK1_000829 [Pneumocystis canis]KAG5437425.1 hypothetical protein PCANB_000856 [Pneumocystis canis]